LGARDELIIPPGAVTDAGSAEVLRAWVANGGLHVSLKPSFDTPDVWGVLLVDVARHAARAFAADKHMTEAQAFARIRKMFDAEWRRPTDLGQTAAAKKQ
jgi:Domain of unknown function (DUF5076)